MLTLRIAPRSGFRGTP